MFNGMSATAKQTASYYSTRFMDIFSDKQKSAIREFENSLKPHRQAPRLTVYTCRRSRVLLQTYGRWMGSSLGEVKALLEAVLNEVPQMGLGFDVQESSTSADMTLPSANEAPKKPASFIE
ncbi:unnamed protein product [Penicillium pancosmium]